MLATTTRAVRLIIDRGAVDHVTGRRGVHPSAVIRANDIAPRSCPNMAMLIAVHDAVAADHVIDTAFTNQCP
jgi:hypothetical protein